MIDRRYFKEIDWILIGLFVLNSAIGIVLITSAARYLPGNFYIKQILWLVVGLGVLFLTVSIDYKVLMSFSPYLYGLFVLALAGLFVFGRITGGAKSWYRISFFGGQPSELAKVVVILVLALIFANFRRSYLSPGFAALSSAAAILPIALIALQPDMGTAVSFLPLLLASLFLAGMNKKWVAVLLIASLLLGVAGWNFFLKDYQKKRLMTLVNPSQDPRGSGYQVLQSKIAVGSGGLTGKGFGKGTQSQLRFLPARHTDFIFAVLGEEFGYAGILIVLLTYFGLLARIFRAVGESRDRAGVYIVFMVASLLTFPFVSNVLMVVGLFPVTGIPIPLLSYGGSSFLATSAAVGLVLNVKMRRFVYV